jgi:penicillin-binding protein 2
VRTATLPNVTDESTRLRLTFLAALLVTVFAILVVRLWYIQIVTGERYAALAERNRVRTVALEAPRGRVLDRAGRVLVDNRQVHVLGVRTDEMGDRREAVLSDLARLLGIAEADLHDRIAQAPEDPVRPVPVAFDVPERIALFVWEHQSTRFPGVYAELLARRTYPHGQLAAHVLGYAGQVTEELLAQPAYADVDPGAQVGLAGVERSYDRVLGGAPGRRVFEIDATGDVVRQLSERLPTPGADLQLTIDLDAQRLAERALAEGIAQARKQTDREDRGSGRFAAPAGAAVVLDPRDGALRAVASYPTFTPEAFVGGIDADSYAALIDPASNAPLINRGVQSAYPPGSVFKIVTAAAALRHRFATPETTFPCPGAWRWNGSGPPFRNWTPADLGDMTLSESLAQSCDTVYYELAKRMWEAEERSGSTREYVGQEARRFGFGAASGVDLPGERDGMVPGRRALRESASDPVGGDLTEASGQWRGGDAVNVAVGQGTLLTSPLQVAVSMAAVANAGAVPAPHVGATVHDPDGSSRAVRVREPTAVDLDPDALDTIRLGLEGVTAPGGTAGDAFAGAAMPVAGKTGTAEAGSDQPFAWFAGYGPTNSARHVVVVMVEQGGSGSTTAAPIAREIFDDLAALDDGARS